MLVVLVLWVEAVGEGHVTLEADVVVIALVLVSVVLGLGDDQVLLLAVI